jgi:hypothetical protein
VQTQPQPGSIHGVQIANAGTDCTEGGTLSTTGGGGTGFAADFAQTGGAISAVSVTSRGQGYTSTPTIVIDSGGAGCAGYTLTPAMTLLGDHYGSFFTTVSGRYSVHPALYKQGGLNASYFGNMWLAGEPDMTRVDATVDFDWGTGLIMSLVTDRASVRWEGLIRVPWEGGIPGSVPPGGIWKVDVLKPGSGCAAGEGTITASGGGGGSGFLAAFTVGTVTDADGNSVSGIVEVRVTRRGAGWVDVCFVCIYVWCSVLMTVQVGVLSFIQAHVRRRVGTDELCV